MPDPRLSGSSAIGRLEAALREVLLDAFDEQCHSMADGRSWYRESLPATELFRLWVCDNYESCEDAQWVFQPIRPSERGRLCDALGIARSTIIGLTPRAVANLILTETGLPPVQVSDLEHELSYWKDAIALIERSEDEKASVQLRVLGERILKRMIYFHCATGYANDFLEVVRNPGSLRVPPKLAKLAAKDNLVAEPELIETFSDDGWADLGFLTLALKKLSTRLEAAGRVNLNGDRMRLFVDAESTSFLQLATALQGYVHDKPSQLPDRKSHLLTAARAALEACEAMILRRVVPEEALVLQRSESLLGLFCHGYSGGRVSVFACDALPVLGTRVLFTMRTERNYGTAVWTPSLSKPFRDS